MYFIVVINTTKKVWIKNSAFYWNRKDESFRFPKGNWYRKPIFICKKHPSNGFLTAIVFTTLSWMFYLNWFWIKMKLLKIPLPYSQYNSPPRLAAGWPPWTSQTSASAWSLSGCERWPKDASWTTSETDCGQTEPESWRRSTTGTQRDIAVYLFFIIGLLGRVYGVAGQKQGSSFGPLRLRRTTRWTLPSENVVEDVLGTC